MGRNRVLSFMSQFSNRDSERSSTPTSSPAPVSTRQEYPKYEPPRLDFPKTELSMPTGPSDQPAEALRDSPQARPQRERASSRPMSMIYPYHPPLMELTQDTLPELQPIFTLLNSHGNKLYQEGYFLKLDDQNTHGRANADRTWTECFAQLVGTIISLWDAAELDAAGQDGEVLPKFINLTDASIKMIESLPTRSNDEAPLQNVLSISTAGKNRYLLHFNSHHSLIQWTAGIRLAMFEHATLQEAYTGALIAGKGKALNNISTIMERSRLKTEDWTRVRFGAGTPWRRCWCVISPPDEKEYQKLQKGLNKKKSAYDRSRPPVLKGDIKFYDTKKTKKVRPIATITDAYSAFAIYPQSKPLIDASTLVKVEGSITINSNPPSTTEGFVFVMPEVHPAVTGFEMMLRWLFPVFDTFGLYGRPGRLVADTLDPRSLMFAMPKHRRHGYLEILDVSGLILTDGSGNWRESEWRRKMKELTSRRKTAIENGSRTNSRYSSRRNTRNSFGPSRSRVGFDDGASIRSSPSISWSQGPPADIDGIPRTDSAPPGAGEFTPPRQPSAPHHRSVSETHGLNRYQNQSPSRYDGGYEQAPTPPPHSVGLAPAREGSSLRHMKEIGTTPERISSEDEQAARATPVRELQELQATTTPEPVASPPAFAHAPGTLPMSKPYHSPELRRANSRMSNATLSQLAGAGGVAAWNTAGERPRTSEDQRRQNVGRYSEDRGQKGVLQDANIRKMPANQNGVNEGLVAARTNRLSSDRLLPPPIYNSNVQTSQYQEHQIPFSSPTDLATNSQRESGRPEQQPNVVNADATTHRSYDAPPMPASTDPNIQNSRPLQRPNEQGHASHPSKDSTRSQPSRLQTSQSILRKPLPARASSIQKSPDEATPQTASSGGSLGQHVIDQAAFDLVIPRNQAGKLTPRPEAQMRRQNSNVSSLYEDTASTATPDYASTRRSFDTQESLEKPRAGVMRTVGNMERRDPELVIGDTRYGGSSKAPGSAIPDVDFGPTLNYAVDRAPQHQSPARRASPNQPQSSDRHSRSPSRNLVTPEHAYYRNDSGDGRSLAWQPGMSAIGGSPAVKQQAITPEQFVHQRAAAATPLYAHQRQLSGNVLNSGTPTPPLVRKRSSEFLAQQTHSRNSSAELLQRPSSRGPSVALGPSGTGDYASHLSAREQEHLAKVTGQPLINMTSNNNRQAALGGGLVGAIEAREKERQQMKQGLSSQAVQHAIAQRQQQAQSQGYQQYPEQSSGDYRASQYGSMGQYPLPQFPVQSQRQQSWISPAANVYAQGGGWSAPAPASAPAPGFPTPPEQQQPPQQQYFAPPQQQQGQGRGYQGYHGHGL